MLSFQFSKEAITLGFSSWIKLYDYIRMETTSQKLEPEMKKNFKYYLGNKDSLVVASDILITSMVTFEGWITRQLVRG